MTGVVSAFMRRVRERPDAVAVRWAAGDVSYRELAQLAEGYSATIAEHGVTREDPVAVCCARSPRWIACMLGALDAGACYLPLDAGFPVRRNRLVLQRLGARMAFADGPHRARIEGLVEKLVSLEAVEPRAELALGSRAPLAAALAYALPTSGSTGVPKVVGVSHGALASHLAWRARRFPLFHGDRFLQKALPAFDISLWEVLAPLCEGATIVLSRDGGHRDPGYLARLVEEESVTHAHFHPRLLAAFLETHTSKRSLRRLFVGGESLTAELAARVHRSFGATLVHQYGPTETTIDVTAGVVMPGATDPISLGEPVDGCRVEVCSSTLDPSAVGEVGELVVSGPALARGYLADPRATAASFVPDPSGVGARRYRTGDLVASIDGQLAFKGRRDRQIKLRGFRIELEEVEGVARRCPAVDDAAMVVVRSDAELTRTVLFCETQDPGTDAERVRSWLADRLAEYMCPSHVAIVAALPRTPSGKASLRELEERARALLSHSAEAVLDPQIAVFAEAIQRFVGVRPGPDDDFFALGGDSLVAIALLAHLEATLGVRVSLETFFSNPTARGLAKSSGPRSDAASLDVETLAESQLDALLSEHLARSP